MDLKSVPPEEAATTILRRLREQAPVTFLIGSYVSTAESGTPGTGAIAEEIWRAVRSNRYLNDKVRQALAGVDLSKLQFEVLFQLYEDYIDENLTRWLCSITMGDECGPVHSLLGTLAESYPNIRILTTNFDDLIEQGNPRFTEVLEPSAEESSFKVHKLHGSASTPASLVANLRRIGVGLQATWSRFVQDKAENSTLLILGWSGADFDIFPVIQKAVAADPSQHFWTVAPREGYSEEAYNELNWRQISSGLQLVLDYRELMSILAEAHGVQLPSEAHKRRKIESPTFVAELPLAEVSKYIVAILEYTSNCQIWLQIRSDLQISSRPGKNLERKLWIGAGRWWAAYVDCWQTIMNPWGSRWDRALALTDLGAIQGNHRNPFAALGSLSTYLGCKLALSQRPRTFQEYDTAIRCVLHWSIGCQVMANVCFGARLTAIARHFDRRSEHYATVAAHLIQSAGDVYRRLTLQGETNRGKRYAGKAVDERERLLVLRHLNQIGRGYDRTVFIEDALSEARDDELRFWRTALIEVSVKTAIERWWPLVLLKALPKLAALDPAYDDFVQGAKQWAYRAGGFGFFRPALKRPWWNLDFAAVNSEREELLKTLNQIQARNNGTWPGVS